MPNMRIFAYALITFLAALPLRADDLKKADLTIATQSGGSFHFDVEIAATPEQQERGLMFRDKMAADAGMIFPQESDRTMEFWMKNTYLPLDMIFIASNGRIAHIAPDAIPRSEKTIPSGGPIRAVLELNGGTAAKLGIHVGDIVAFQGLGGSR
jgi:uncharacterized membrane protein (UPF0127 family)